MPLTNVLNLGPPPGAKLGEALGQSIGRSVPGPEQVAQRRMLSNALDKVGALAQNPNANPIDISLAFLKAGAGIPGFERYAMPLLDKFLQMSAYSKPINAQTDIIPGSESGPQYQSQPQTVSQPVPSTPAMSGVQPKGLQSSQPGEPPEGQPIKLGNFIPVDIGKVINPQQRQKIIDDVGKEGKDVELARRRIDEYNKGLIDYNELQNSVVDRQYKQMGRQLEQENRIRNFIDERLGETVPDARKNIYYNLMKKELENTDDMTTAYQRAVPKIQSYEKSMKELPSKIPESELIGLNKQQKEQQRSITKNIMEIDPLAYQTLEEFYKAKGHSITDIADTLKPLPKEISNITKNATDYRDYLFPKYVASEKQMNNLIDQAMSGQEKEIAKLANKLKQNWNEDLSLINIYTDLKIKGWFPQNIQKLFAELKEMGAPFSEQQEAEIVQLGSPPKITINRMHDI